MAQLETAKAGRVYLANVSVWTPSGEEVWSGNVAEKKAQQHGRTITDYQQWEAMGYAKGQNGFVPSSGLWYQSRARLQKDRPEIEKDFTAGELEDTSTVLKFLKKGEKHADGLVIQYPIPNEEGTDFERDERSIPKARQIWQMALPVNDSYVRQMPAEFDTFLDTICGMSEARKQLPDFAYVWISPEGERRVLRGHWRLHPREDRRVHVLGNWEPAGRASHVGFRVFEGGEESIKAVDARKRRLVVEATAEELNHYKAELSNLGINFTEE